MGSRPICAAKADRSPYDYWRDYHLLLGKTSDFNVLLGLLLVLAICCEGAFWPAILSSVRKSTSDEQQSKVFGFLEGGRGLIEFLQNAITLGLYAFLDIASSVWRSLS